MIELVGQRDDERWSRRTCENLPLYASRFSRRPKERGKSECPFIVGPATGAYDAGPSSMPCRSADCAQLGPGSQLPVPVPACPKCPPRLGPDPARDQRPAEVGLDQVVEGRSDPTASVDLAVDQHVADGAPIDPQDSACHGEVAGERIVG